MKRTHRHHRLMGCMFYYLYVQRVAAEPPSSCQAGVMARLQAGANSLDELYMDVLLEEARQLIQPC